ncbi:ABC transporter permease [Alicyclobacillus macrosporangiidus]|uniref:ABC transporter permease n=1 Tax=Alicyclobacillus macrosporangiidus TaxID=392015 RepID=UPI000497A2C5|nr:ABC transporter permease [Alicyclobacillus macrosporangiidus]
MAIEIIRVAWRSLRANKLRSFLTMLGIIIGVMAVILSSAIGLGTKNGVTRSVESLGSNVLTVMRGSAQSRGISQGVGSATTMTAGDVQQILDQDPDVAYASPVVTTNAQVVYGSNNTNTSIVGTNDSYAAIRNVTIQQGRYLMAQDVISASHVAVLGSSVAQTLFGGRNPVGETILIQSIPFEVIGVAAPQGANGLASADDMINIPYTTETSLLTGNNRINQIVASAKSPDVMYRAQLEIESTLRVAHQLKAGMADDFNILNQTTVLNTLGNITQMLTLLLDGISAISLLVGGIGIMNIMLVSVTERTREIGIRKAIGAKKGVILFQFLLESLTLSVAGALMGVAIGGIGALVAGRLMNAGNLFSPVAAGLGVVFSVVIGIVFGVYPARKAANLKPIDALRFE